MKEFLDDDFLLNNKTADYLYHEHAARMPIIDYHCHLDPALIASNEKFTNITQAWLYGDHYKWRSMRANGIPEQYCTGDAPDQEKFRKWAETVPHTLRNPHFHWTHMELKRYFGIGELLNPETADSIYVKSSTLLQEDAFRPQELLKKMNVKIVCTTDDPVDTLEHHRNIAAAQKDIKVIPAWRPDRVMTANDPLIFNKYVDAVASASAIGIDNYDKLIEALRKRHDFFHANGCRLSDHGMDTFYAEDYTMGDIHKIFGKVRNGRSLNQDEILKFKSSILYDLAIMDHDKGWTQQYHIGPLRNNNSRLYQLIGPDIGCDSIGDRPLAYAMSGFLDRLDRDKRLAKTIVYNLNPAYNEVMVTMAGNFQDGTVPGKIQWGSAWWFLDQKDGIEKHLNALSNHGLLSRFIGMLTDSRSLLSYPRHEYFRRILCNLIGTDVEKGEIPGDRKWLGQIVEDICYNNALNYFAFKDS